MTLPEETDERLARLQALEIALLAHGFVADLIRDRYLRVHTPQVTSVIAYVRCVHRQSDGGRLWYLDGDNPLAQADNITEALTALKGILPADASRSGTVPGRVPGRDAPKA